MEIVIAMVLTILEIVWTLIQSIVIVGIVAVGFALIGVAGIYTKAWIDTYLPKKKDRDDFEEPRVSEIFDKDSSAYWRELDSFNDKQIFENTKDYK